MRHQMRMNCESAQANRKQHIILTMFVISIQSRYMFKQARLLSTYKSVAGFFAALNWILVFLAASIAGPALAASGSQAQFGHAVITPVVPPAPLVGIVDPAQLPESNETVDEDGANESDDEERSSFFADYVQHNTAQILQQLQQVKTFRFQLTAQQDASIPLFILHHSWKAYLI